MKLKKIILLAFFPLFFSSCFEIEETYVIKEDGSYQMSYNLDMGKVLDVFGAMIPDSVTKDKKFTTVKDTTINFANAVTDSLSKKLNNQEKTLLKQTDMRMQMDMQKNIFKISFKNEGKSPSELNYFLGNFDRLLKQTNAKDLMNAGAQLPQEKIDTENDNSLFNANEYDYVITKSTFQRKIKAELFRQNKEKKQESYDLMKGMNIKMPYTIIINLPRPATSVDHPKAILSSDKKQFKLSIDMMEVLEDPNVLNFKVNY